MSRLDPSADFLRLAQVAELLGVSQRTVQRECDRGELPCAYIGGCKVIPRAAYEALRDRLNTEAGVVPAVRPLKKVGAR